MIAFNVMEPNWHLLVGYKHLPCHMLWDVKIWTSQENVDWLPVVTCVHHPKPALMQASSHRKVCRSLLWLLH
jgi:hypothetical protein